MMSFEVRISEITDYEHRILDLAKLFELSENCRSQAQRPRAPLALADRSANAKLLSAPSAGAMKLKGRSPILPERRRRTTLGSLAPVFRSLVAKKPTRPQTLPGAQEVPVVTVEGTGSEMSRQFNLRETGTKTLRVPQFLDRYITAGVLKRWANCPGDDLLLRKVGSEWDIVKDNEVIDLANRTVTYRLGPVEMYS